MSASVKTILIIGATSGIGEAFARRFHAQGKRVIATGRREDNLKKLASDCSGLETYVMDNSDLSGLAGHVEKLVKMYPDINAVWLNSGIQYSYSFVDDLSKFGDEDIIREINVNLTAHTILARHFVPHLLSLKSEAILMITTSGIAYVPFGAFPVYGATKAGVRHLCCALRQHLADTDVRVWELATPYVDTGLDANHKEASAGNPPMPLDEYTEAVFQILDTSKAKDLREVAVGMAAMAAQAWRGAFQPVLDMLGSPA